MTFLALEYKPIVITIELESPLTVDECEARLRAAIDGDGPFSWFGSRPVVGHVSRSAIQLRKRDWLRNSFRTYLFGHLETRSRKTMFIGHLAMHPLIMLFQVVWFGLLVTMGVLTVLKQNTFRDQLLAGLGFLFFMGFGLLLLWLGRWLAKNEGPFLVAFVADVIDASTVDKVKPKAFDVR